MSKNKVDDMYKIDQEIDQVLDNFKETKKVVIYKNKVDKNKLKENLISLVFVFIIGLLLSGLSIWISLVACLIVASCLTWREVDKEIIIKD